MSGVLFNWELVIFGRPTSSKSWHLLDVVKKVWPVFERCERICGVLMKFHHVNRCSSSSSHFTFPQWGNHRKPNKSLHDSEQLGQTAGSKLLGPGLYCNPLNKALFLGGELWHWGGLPLDSYDIRVDVYPRSGRPS